MAGNEFVSPLMSRMQKQPPLSLKNLAHHIPRVREGREAAQRLAQGGDFSFEEKRALHRAKKDGEAAKEELVLMALPLVQTIARKEYQRRTAWSSRVTLDDMIQEGIGGFLRGIEAYNLEGSQTSATNYLGQWVVSDIRRHVESLDHDFSIPHETIERHRKIRAIRSLLYNRLSRYPTDEEIIEHANSVENQPINKMGKLNKNTKEVSTSRRLTQKHIDEERDFSASTGVLESLTITDDENSEYERKANNLDGTEAPTSTAAVEDRSAKAAMAAFFDSVFYHMNLGSVQEDIIRRKHGFPPYRDEIPLTEISQATAISKYKVNQIITAFTTEMSSPGSSFHRSVSNLPEDERDSLGLTWVIKALGHYDQHTPRVTNPMLTREIKITPRMAKKSFGEADRPLLYNYMAYYVCDEGHKSEKALFVSQNKQRALSSCLTCGGPVVCTGMVPLNKKQ